MYTFAETFLKSKYREKEKKQKKKKKKKNTHVKTELTTPSIKSKITFLCIKSQLLVSKHVLITVECLLSHDKATPDI